MNVKEAVLAALKELILPDLDQLRAEPQPADCIGAL
jgi:hypothetical protein